MMSQAGSFVVVMGKDIPELAAASALSLPRTFIIHDLESSTRQLLSQY